MRWAIQPLRAACRVLSCTGGGEGGFGSDEWAPALARDQNARPVRKKGLLARAARLVSDCRSTHTAGEGLFC